MREGAVLPRPQDDVEPDLHGVRDVHDYLRRTASTRIDAVGADRYARFFREAPETKGQRMRDLTRQDFQRYRERRLQQGEAPGCRRRGQVSATAVNKELRFACAVFNDFLSVLDDRGEEPIPNPVRKLSRPEPTHRNRYLTEDEGSRLRSAMTPPDWSPVLVAMNE